MSTLPSTQYFSFIINFNLKKYGALIWAVFVFIYSHIYQVRTSLILLLPSKRVYSFPLYPASKVIRSSILLLPPLALSGNCLLNSPLRLILLFFFFPMKCINIKAETLGNWGSQVFHVETYPECWFVPQDFCISFCGCHTFFSMSNVLKNYIHVHIHTNTHIYTYVLFWYFSGNVVE